MGLSSYPTGTDNSDFCEETVTCERCGSEVPFADECQGCGATLDAELAWEQDGPDEDSYPERER